MNKHMSSIKAELSYQGDFPKPIPEMFSGKTTIEIKLQSTFET